MGGHPYEEDRDVHSSNHYSDTQRDETKRLLARSAGCDGHRANLRGTRQCQRYCYRRDDDRRSTDPRAMHGQAVLAGTRMPVSVILDCLTVGMTAKEILTEYPIVTEAGNRAAAAYGATLAREELLPLPHAE